MCHQPFIMLTKKDLEKGLFYNIILFREDYTYSACRNCCHQNPDRFNLRCCVT